MKARKEVILSAGTIGTTQILQLSGIGNADDLKALNIPVLIDNPAVGANLIDHVFLPNIFNAQESLDMFLRDSSLVGAAIEEWTTNKTGIIANNIANTFGFARLPSHSPIFKTVADPASGPKSPHWEMLFSVSSLHLVRVLLWPVLIFLIGFLGQPGHCSTSYGKLFDYSHRVD